MELRFGLRVGGNVLLVGRDEKAALGVLAACTLALAAHAAICGETSSTIHLLDGSLPHSDSAETWQQLSAAVVMANQRADDGSQVDQQRLRIESPRGTLQIISAVHSELQRRADEPGPPQFLMVYDLARFRDLKKSDDEYSYGSSVGGGEKPINPAQLFSEIVRDGPGVGIFTLVWADSYQTTQRWLSRDQMNRFDQRVLFAMNANDSSSLVDSPLAGRLGENRGLLYRGDLGTLEKFRPFSPPSGKWLSQWKSGSHSNGSLGTTTADVSTSETIPDQIIGTEPAITGISTELSPEIATAADLPSIDELNVQ